MSKLLEKIAKIDMNSIGNIATGIGFLGTSKFYDKVGKKANNNIKRSENNLQKVQENRKKINEILNKYKIEDNYEVFNDPTATSLSISVSPFKNKKKYPKEKNTMILSDKNLEASLHEIGHAVELDKNKLYNRIMMSLALYKKKHPSFIPSSAIVSGIVSEITKNPYINAALITPQIIEGAMAAYELRDEYKASKFVKEHLESSNKKDLDNAFITYIARNGKEILSNTGKRMTAKGLTKTLLNFEKRK